MAEGTARGATELIVQARLPLPRRLASVEYRLYVDAAVDDDHVGAQPVASVLRLCSHSMIGRRCGLHPLSIRPPCPNNKRYQRHSSVDDRAKCALSTVVPAFDCRPGHPTTASCNPMDSWPPCAAWSSSPARCPMTASRCPGRGPRPDLPTVSAGQNHQLGPTAAGARIGAVGPSSG
jgi:hypothetical protein